jgi:two-component system chemotaxis response regulator CheY
MTGQTVIPILIVDDEDDARELLRTALEGAGYLVLEANNGGQALSLLTAAGAPEPSLIILDLNMPVMTGWEFLAIVRSYHRLSRIPVLVVSGAIHPDVLAHGTVAHRLAKPIAVDELLARVTAILAGPRPP